MFTDRALDLAERVLAGCRASGFTLVTAESCTGGLIAGCLTEIAGSSDVIDCGFVTYSNAAKQRILGVPPDMLAVNGAVSEQVARAMAEGARDRTGCDIAIAVTGIAGPGGGTAEKPVGLVHIACARREQPTLHQRYSFGDQGRAVVRQLTVRSALELVAKQLEGAMLA
jgi:nicotinamide-nucleotide amidase